MTAPYRLGTSCVAFTLGLSVLVCIELANPRPDPPPAAEDLSSAGKTVGPFRLTERSGRTVAASDLADRPWIVAFVFSRCPSSCPRISAVMKGLQARLTGTGISLVSLSVDPEYDTPEVLRRFADRYGADPDRWLFLTGPKAKVYRLIIDDFRQSVAAGTPDYSKDGVEAVSHSERLVLVGPGNRVLGAYTSSDPDAVTRLTERARTLDRMARAARTGWVLRLPTLNAILNGSCALLLAFAWTLIRRGRVAAHAATMVTALIVSALFLTSYLVYHYHVGSIAFRGTGPIRVAYLSILLSHTLLAIAAVPLIVATLVLAIRTKFAAHAKVARVTFPIWMYVSITGVIVYLMLYHLPVATASTL